MLKARIKKTGAILYVEEITNNAIFLRHPFDPELKAACTPQEVDFIGEEDKVQIDWEQRRYELAKEAMGAFIDRKSVV